MAANQRLSRLKCLDPKGFPNRDKDGKPTEKPPIYDGKKWSFKPGEEILMDSNMANWFAKRYPARLKVTDEAPLLNAVLMNGNVTLVDPVTHKPIGDRLHLRKNQPPETTKGADGVPTTDLGLGESPHERLGALNAALQKGEKGDVTVG
jgi:hypothetical protein